jgi:hypothetical protein
MFEDATIMESLGGWREAAVLRLFIPRVAVEHANFDYVCAVFAAKNAGQIVKADFAPRRDGSGWMKAELAISVWRTEKGDQIAKRLAEEGSHKLYYSKETPWFYWLLLCPRDADAQGEWQEYVSGVGHQEEADVRAHRVSAWRTLTPWC